MANNLTPMDRAKILSKGIEEGKIDITDSPHEYIEKITKLIGNYAEYKEFEVDETFDNQEELARLASLQGNVIAQEIRNNPDIRSSQYVDLANKYNSLNTPYNAIIIEDDKGTQIGFSKKVKGYSKDWNNMKPGKDRYGGWEYIKYYEDGSIDNVNEVEFNNRKNISIAPSYIQSKLYEDIILSKEETSLEDTENVSK